MNEIDVALVKDELKNKRWESLLEYLDTLSNDKKDNLFVITAHYKAFNGLGEYEVSEKYIDKALEVTTKNPTLWRDKGLCYQRRKEYDSVLTCYSMAIKIRPDIASYYVLKAKVYFLINEFSNSIINYRLALEINPNQLSWLKSLGNILILNNKRKEAIEVYANLLEYEDNYHIRAIYEELKHQNLTGISQASSQYYDNVFSNSKKYLESGESSIYIDVWTYIVTLLKENSYTHILDLGCGPGQFAEFINKRLDNLLYTGIDFSISALSIAKKRCPNFAFINKTLPITNFAFIPQIDVVICTEVLEHIETDIDILKNIDKGRPIIASVPNFDSFSHVRYFNSIDEVKQRYSFLFKDLSIKPFALNSKSIIWVMFGIKS
jgi:tetratricopeptide (TPR) repeat protein